VAVLGSPRFEQSRSLNEILTPSAEFAVWATDRGVPLTATPESLAELDGHLDDWRDADTAPSLGNEVGLYIWGRFSYTMSRGGVGGMPNGHPVIRLLAARRSMSFVWSTCA
jgi:hypothetical protein